VHHDLKLANVMVSQDLKTLWIVDFGLSINVKQLAADTALHYTADRVSIDGGVITKETLRNEYMDRVLGGHGTSYYKEHHPRGTVTKWDDSGAGNHDITKVLAMIDQFEDYSAGITLLEIAFGQTFYHFMHGLQVNPSRALYKSMKPLGWFAKKTGGVVVFLTWNSHLGWAQDTQPWSPEYYGIIYKLMTHELDMKTGSAAIVTAAKGKVTVAVPKEDVTTAKNAIIAIWKDFDR